MKIYFFVLGLSLITAGCSNPLGDASSNINIGYHPGVPVPFESPRQSLQMSSGFINSSGAVFSTRASMTTHNHLLKGTSFSGKVSFNQTTMR